MRYALALVFFLLYAALSVSRQLQLRTTGYDLGIFEQAVRGYAHLGPPVAELKGPGFVLLTDHFHPILAVLAPSIGHSRTHARCWSRRPRCSPCRWYR